MAAYVRQHLDAVVVAHEVGHQWFYNLVGNDQVDQPWLDEASLMNPYTYNIAMNADTAKEKGLRDGDVVELESATGRKVSPALTARSPVFDASTWIAVTSRTPSLLRRRFPSGRPCFARC